MFDQTGMELFRLRINEKQSETTTRKAGGGGKSGARREYHNPDWEKFEATIATSGMNAALKTLPKRVRMWWEMHQAGATHVEIGRETKSSRSTVGKSILKIRRLGESHGY